MDLEQEIRLCKTSNYKILKLQIIYEGDQTDKYMREKEWIK